MAVAPNVQAETPSHAKEGRFIKLLSGVCYGGLLQRTVPGDAGHVKPQPPLPLDFQGREWIE